MTSEAILRPGETCLTLARADRLGVLIDGANYFRALRSALVQARRSVVIVGWDINSGLVLDPDAPGPDGEPETLGRLVERLARERPRLHVRILIWDWVLLQALERQPLPARRFTRNAPRRVRFVLDAGHPPTACHHEKIVTIDDRLAFVGGLDLTLGRWDRRDHAANEPARGDEPPFHDLAWVADGDAAGAVADLVRARWRDAAGVRLPRVAATTDDLWPDGVPALLRGAPVALARTRPAWDGREGAGEIAALYGRAIGSARRTIYIENQYLTAEPIADLLARRLAEPDGPEVVIVGTRVLQTFLEAAVMNQGLVRFVERLRRADVHGRLRVLTPIMGAPGGPATPVMVHAKVLIVDDRLLTFGSANLSNRSFAVDSETNLAVEAEEGDHAAAAFVASVRHDLVAEHVGASVAETARVERERGSLIGALAVLNGRSPDRRLEALAVEAADLPPEAVEVAALADPGEPLDAEAIGARLLPPARRRRLRRALLRVGLVLAVFAVLALAVLPEGAIAARIAEGLRASRELPFARVTALAAFVLGAFALLPPSLMAAALAAIFGAPTGLGLALAGVLLASGALFAAGRLAGREAARRVAGRHLDVLRRRLTERGAVLALVLLHLVPVMPFAAVNLAAGAFGLRARDVLGANLLGLAPGVLAFALVGDRLGATLRRPDGLNVVLLALAALAALGLGALLARRATPRRRTA